MKRFGVSLPEELAKAVDKLSEDLGTTRSSVIAQAVSAFLAEHAQHLQSGHQCTGAILSLTEGVEAVNEAVEGHKELIANYTHLHLGGRCISVLVVHGDGKRIGEFIVALSERALKTYFAPIE